MGTRTRPDQNIQLCWPLAGLYLAGRKSIRILPMREDSGGGRGRVRACMYGVDGGGGGSESAARPLLTPSWGEDRRGSVVVGEGGACRQRRRIAAVTVSIRCSHGRRRRGMRLTPRAARPPPGHCHLSPRRGLNPHALVERRNPGLGGLLPPLDRERWRREMAARDGGERWRRKSARRAHRFRYGAGPVVRRGVVRDRPGTAAVGQSASGGSGCPGVPARAAGASSTPPNADALPRRLLF
jgi:hypothetical protein